ncbi:WG repeat-containing protein [Desulfovibrio litoralis]|uniref:WG containing repeat-containing protein n=1 Tax=Desulfovibrio litoralis DSM 11393 TaxID=1121455 RepID=A0A1M7SRR1_9BACT|nr:WG repeat-containing protein [Desulfovibrio litoralis]SHN61205.1 WG containing repeat-containing protein [Desulfovibrio litoralis DSM 11393]
MLQFKLILSCICLVSLILGCTACSNSNNKANQSLAKPTTQNVDWIPWLGKNGKYGYADRQGNIHIKPRFVLAEPFEFGRAAVATNAVKGWGFIDSEGNWLIKPQFTSLSNGKIANGNIDIDPKTLTLSEGMFGIKFKVSEGVKESYYINSVNQIYSSFYEALQSEIPSVVKQRAMEMKTQIVGTDYQRNFFFYLIPNTEYSEKDKELSLIYRNTLAGIMDKNGQILTKPTYDLAYLPNTTSDPTTNFNPYTPQLIKQGELFGYQNFDGTILVKPRFIDANPFQNDYAQVKEGKFWGLLDKNANFIAPPMFDRILKVLPANLMIVEYKGKRMLWDIENKRDWSINFPYPAPGSQPLKIPDNFFDDVSVLSLDNSPNTQNNIEQNNILILVKKQGRIDIFDKNGDLLGTYKDYQYDNISKLWVKNSENKWGIIDIKNKKSTEFKYDYDSLYDSSQKGFVIAQKGTQRFYIDSNEREYREK